MIGVLAAPPAMVANSFPTNHPWSTPVVAGMRAGAVTNCTDELPVLFTLTTAPAARVAWEAKLRMLAALAPEVLRVVNPLPRVSAPSASPTAPPPVKVRVARLRFGTDPAAPPRRLATALTLLSKTTVEPLTVNPVLRPAPVCLKALAPKRLTV